MKRKLLKIFATLFIGVICVLGISACGEKHAHTYTDSVTAPTCTAQGFTTHTCECGDTYVDSYVNSLGHNFEDYIYDNNATCLKDGTETAVCTRCSNEGRIVVDTRTKKNTKLSHTYDQQIATQKYVKTAATCTNKAIYYYSCSCGAIGTETFEYGTTLNHAYNQKNPEEKYFKTSATCTSKAKYYYSCTCGAMGTETFEYGNMLEHTYEQENTDFQFLKTPATCTNKAVYYKSCACGAIGTTTFEYGDIREHTYDKEIAENRYLKDEATCTSKAVYYYSCVCGDIGNTTFQYGTFAPHAWNQGVETKQATCTETGKMLYTCESCFTEKTETVQRKEHEITKKVISATCSEPGYTLSYCKTCTTYSSWDNFTPSKGHSGSSYCYDCGKSYVALLGNYIQSVGDYSTDSSGGRYGMSIWATSTIKYMVYYYPNTNKLIWWTQHYKNGELTTSFNLIMSSANGSYDWDLYVFASSGGMLTVEGTVQASSFSPSTTKLSYYNIESFPVISISADLANQASQTAATALQTVVLYLDTILKLCPENITIKDFGFSNYSNAIEHEHEWEQVGSYTKSTCTSNGKVKYECTLDGCSVTKTETISAHGHIYNDVQEVQKATCTQIGILREKCALCGNKKDTTVDMLPHNNQTVVTKSTCTEQGYTTHTCQDCGHVAVDNYINALGHEISTHYTYKEQSCTETGIERYTCCRCDYYEDGTIPMNPHNHQEIDGDDGYITTQCSECKGVFATPIAYEITYDLGGGAVTNRAAYNIETETFTLVVPERTGYTFIGWTGTDLTEKTMTVTIPKGTIGAREYTAHWQANKYKVTYDANGGTASKTEDTATYDSNFALASMENMPNGYEFLGWYNGAERFTAGTWKTANNVTLTAKYAPINYRITYNLNGGTKTDQQTYTIEDVVKLSDPKREGYVFIGWTSVDIVEPTLSVTLPQGTFGALEYTAHWTLDGVNVLRFNNDIIKGLTELGKTLNIIELPRQINGMPITSISDYAFFYCNNLTEIVIPDSVTSIGDNAFEHCDGLTSIEVSDSNTEYKSIDGNLYSKDGRTLIQYAIGKTATSFAIPDSVTSIGDDAFCYCDNLTKIVIPDSVTSIGDGAFFECDSLTSIEVSDGNAEYKSIDGNLYSKDGTTLILYAPGKTVASFAIPDSITSIGDRAFSYCNSLTSVVIPDSVTSIGDRAFRYCDGLTKIVIPDAVTSIGDQAFYHCSSLTEIVIPDAVTSIGKGTFSDCYRLTSVVIGNGVTSIYDNAFDGCTSLTRITFKDTSTWYRTFNYSDWKDKTLGTKTDVTTPSNNVKYFTGRYCYLYKL